MTHDIDTQKTQTKAPAIALSSSQAPAASPPPVTDEKAYEALSNMELDIPLHIGDLLPGLREAMDNARCAYHRGADGQDILTSQAQALDALFIRVLDRATARKNGRGEDIPNYLHEGYINVALRTQRHCRKTIETLVVLQEREKRARELKEAKNAKYYKRLADEAAFSPSGALQGAKTMESRNRTKNSDG